MVNAFASASVMFVQCLASRLQIPLLDNLQDALVRGNQIPDITGYILVRILYSQEHSSIKRAEQLPHLDQPAHLSGLDNFPMEPLVGVDLRQTLTGMLA